jgi:DHA1 family multidrug resistance protein-like MFS transporter
MWLGVFAIQFGFALSSPYIALYIQRNFGVTDPGRLALVSGLVIASGPVTQAIFSPVWGAVGDRFGRIPMVLRALGTSSFICALASFVPSVMWLAAVRVIAGAGSGVGASATAVVADGTPMPRLAWSLGLMGAAVALGQVGGPIAGGALAAVIPIRWLFLVGGVFLGLSVLPVALLSREPPRQQPRGHAVGVGAALDTRPAGTRQVLVVLGACVGLTVLTASGTQQLLVLRLIELKTPSTSLAIGGAFSAFGLATTVASLLCSRLVPRLGFRPAALAGAAVLALAVVGCAVAPGPLLVLVAATFAGVGYGLLIPTLNSMLGIEAPSAIKATIFGFVASAQTLGYGCGPLLGGAVTAVAGLAWGFAALAAASVAAAILVAMATREPVPAL